MSYLNTALPVVFTGVDADPSKYGYPAANVTGIIERPHFKESLAFAQRLRPIKRIAVLSCHDSTSILALGFMKQEQLDVEVAEWLMVDDFDGWKKAVERFNRSVDAIVIRFYEAVKKPGSAENMAPCDVALWTSQHATVATIAFHDFEIEDGLLVGVVKSGQEYVDTREYALRILAGMPPSSLPIIKPSKGVKMINRVTAARLGIAVAGEVSSDTILVPKDWQAMIRRLTFHIVAASLPSRPSSLAPLSGPSLGGAATHRPGKRSTRPRLQQPGQRGTRGVIVS